MTMERIVPDELDAAEITGGQTLSLHLDRYRFAAAELTAPRRILDMACGVGYGSHLLAQRYPDATVVGVDLSAEAVGYARDRYQLPNLTFVAADAMRYLADATFDAVVSLETIEHLPDPEAFLRHVTRTLLASKGMFVGSVPTTPSVDANPHHLTDFSERSFRRLLARNRLVEVTSFRQTQPFNPLKVATRTEDRMKGMRQGMLGYYARHPAGLAKRALSTVVDGFNNKYITIAAHLER